MDRRTLLKGMAAASAVGVAAPALIGTGRAQSKITLKFGHLANEQNVWHKAAMKFAEEVKALTEGRIECAVFPNESLGNELDVIKGMQLGTADMVITGESLQNWAPTASLLAIPYGVTSLAQMDTIASGAIGKQIIDEVIAKAKVRPLCYLARGPRNLTSNRAVVKPEELNGLRLRVPNVPLFVAVWTALGARPTPMAFGEVFTSLQNGTIDGQENPLALIKSANFNEVQKFLNQDRACALVDLHRDQRAALPVLLRQGQGDWWSRPPSAPRSTNGRCSSPTRRRSRPNSSRRA